METRRVKSVAEGGPGQDGPGGTRKASRNCCAWGGSSRCTSQVGRVPGEAGPADLAQRAGGRPHAARALRARHPSQLRPEARPCLEGRLGGTGAGNGRGQRDAVGRGRADPAAARADAQRAGHDDEEGPEPGPVGRHMPSADDDARRGPGHGAGLRHGGRRPDPVPKDEGHRRLGGADAETEPVGGTGRLRAGSRGPATSRCAGRCSRPPR